MLLTSSFITWNTLKSLSAFCDSNFFRGLVCNFVSLIFEYLFILPRKPKSEKSCLKKKKILAQIYYISLYSTPLYVLMASRSQIYYVPISEVSIFLIYTYVLVKSTKKLLTQQLKPRVYASKY